MSIFFHRKATAAECLDRWGPAKQGRDMSKEKFTTEIVELLAQLPPGDWITERISDDTIVFACSEHEPRIAKNGKLEILKPLPCHLIDV